MITSICFVIVVLFNTYLWKKQRYMNEEVKEAIGSISNLLELHQKDLKRIKNEL